MQLNSLWLSLTSGTNILPTLLLFVAHSPHLFVRFFVFPVNCTFFFSALSHPLIVLHYSSLSALGSLLSSPYGISLELHKKKKKKAPPQSRQSHNPLHAHWKCDIFTSQTFPFFLPQTHWAQGKLWLRYTKAIWRYPEMPHVMADIQYIAEIYNMLKPHGYLWVV